MERDGGGRPRAQVQGRGQRRSGLFLCQPPPPLPCRGHMTPPVLRSCAVIVETLHLGDCSAFDVDVIPMLPKLKLSTSWLQHESRDNGRLLSTNITLYQFLWNLLNVGSIYYMYIECFLASLLYGWSLLIHLWLI